MEWHQFYGLEGGWFLEEVAHVTHVQPAVNIFADGRLRAGLVYKESKLTAHRIQVVWLSPTNWNSGYRYGNVRLEFRLSDLLHGRQAYWVEAKEYGIAAPRILITDVDRSEDSFLTLYDPATARGPWWIDEGTGQHLWNPSYTLELLFEGDLPLGYARELSFVKHHPKWCAADNSNCPDGFGRGTTVPDSRFIAGVLGLNVNVSSDLVSEGKELITPVVQALSTLLRRLRGLHAEAATSGCITSKSSEAEAVTRAILTSFGNYDDVRARVLAGLFASPDDLEATYRRVATDIGGLQPWP